MGYCNSPSTLNTCTIYATGDGGIDQRWGVNGKMVQVKKIGSDTLRLCHQQIRFGCRPFDKKEAISRSTKQLQHITTIIISTCARGGR